MLELNRAKLFWLPNSKTSHLRWILESMSGVTNFKEYNKNQGMQ